MGAVEGGSSPRRPHRRRGIRRRPPVTGTCRPRVEPSAGLALHVRVRPAGAGFGKDERAHEVGGGGERCVRPATDQPGQAGAGRAVGGLRRCRRRTRHGSRRGPRTAWMAVRTVVWRASRGASGWTSASTPVTYDMSEPIMMSNGSTPASSLSSSSTRARRSAGGIAAATRSVIWSTVMWSQRFSKQAIGKPLSTARPRCVASHLERPLPLWRPGIFDRLIWGTRRRHLTILSLEARRCHGCP